MAGRAEVLLSLIRAIVLCRLRSRGRRPCVSSLLLMMANRTTLYRRLQNIVLLVYKALNDVASSDIKDLFFLRATLYDLSREPRILCLSRCNTTSYGLNLGPNLWNSLKDNVRLSQDLSSFKNLFFPKLTLLVSSNNSVPFFKAT